MYWWCGCSNNRTLFGKERAFRHLTKYIIFAYRLIEEHKQYLLPQAQLLFNTLNYWDISEKELVELTNLIVSGRVSKQYFANYREMLDIFKRSKFCRREKYQTYEAYNSHELFGIRVFCQSVKYLGRFPEKYEMLDYLRAVYETVFLKPYPDTDDDDDEN